MMIPRDAESRTFERALLSPRNFPKRPTGYPPDHGYEPQSLELKPNRLEHELDLTLIKSLTMAGTPHGFQSLKQPAGH